MQKTKVWWKSKISSSEVIRKEVNKGKNNLEKQQKSDAWDIALQSSLEKNERG